MADDTVTTYNRLAPYIEERGKQLLSATMGDPNAVKQAGESDAAFQVRKFGRAGVPQNIPGFQVAGLSPEQQQAMQMAQQGIGGYQPYLGAAGQALSAGITGLGGAQQMYDPSMATGFMNQYQQDVTRDALAEMDRQAQMAQQGAAAGAVGAGAFGTERYGVQQAEAGRNLQDIKSRRIFEDQSRNYMQAQQAAQQAFEMQQGRQMQATGMYGQLAGQTAGLGSLGQQLYGGDIAQLQQAGTLRQQQAQNVLEAQRQTQAMAAQEPFQRLSFASGILTGTPASQMTVQQQPGTSPFMQAAGLGIMGLGAYKGMNMPNMPF
jgi:hypothetical protein